MLEIDVSYYRNDFDYHYKLNLEQGSVALISGVSGVGKSTLFDILAGHLDAQGVLKLNGEDISNLPANKRAISCLYQQYNLFMHLNVLQNIELAFKKKELKQPQIQQRIANTVEFLGLDGLLTRNITELSGGQQQRVAIARILLQHRDVLLLDEPFNGLNKETRIELTKLVVEIAKRENMVCLIISHQPDEVAPLVDEHWQLGADESKTYFQKIS